MKTVYFIIASLLLSSGLVQATETASIDEPTVYDRFEELTKKPSAKISKQDGWSIVSVIENGNRVYWFLAPDENNVTPALIKKTIFEDKGAHKVVFISKCEAPKQTCDNLMQQFKLLSEHYK